MSEWGCQPDIDENSVNVGLGPKSGHCATLRTPIHGFSQEPPCQITCLGLFGRMFGRRKDFRRIGTRYDRRVDVYLAAIAATVTYWL